jgi:predicted dehydrogenase
MPSQSSGGALSRRSFVKRSAVLTSALAFPFVSVRNVLGANNRLNIVGVGVGGKGWTDITSVASENVIGVCDVDTKRLLKARERFPNCSAFGDWRVMFDNLGRQIDAVTVSTPDHMHFLPALRAVKSRWHVFCQKPLTHTVWEARTLAAAARKAKVATQMGNQGISHPKLRRDAELIRAGVIGDVLEVHGWTDRPGKWWKQGLQRPTEFPRVPADLNWDLWLGGSPVRPYHPQYGHFQWRGWWDYGTGAIGDMGCHLLNCATLALDVRDPEWVSARGEGATADTGPVWSEIEWRFPARNGKPAWKFFWYDGGHKAPADLFPGTAFPDNAMVFVGTKDTFYCPGYNGGGFFKSGATYDDFKSIPEVFPKASNWDACHYEEWIAACKGGPKAYSNFDVAGPVSEVVLLGQVSLRAGKPIDWDAKKMRVTNDKAANQYIRTEYRKGWRI